MRNCSLFIVREKMALFMGRWRRIFCSVHRISWHLFLDYDSKTKRTKRCEEKGREMKKKKQKPKTHLRHSISFKLCDRMTKISTTVIPLSFVDFNEMTECGQNVFLTFFLCQNKVERFAYVAQYCSEANNPCGLTRKSVSRKVIFVSSKITEN